MEAVDNREKKVIEKRCCSFCGKDEDEVHTLIQGAISHICNECVIRCAEVLSNRFLALRDRLRETVVIMDTFERLKG